MTEKEFLEKCNSRLKKRFTDMELEKVNLDNTLVVCNGGYLGMWRIKIREHRLIFRPGYDIHEDLLVLANEFRKEYFNVL